MKQFFLLILLFSIVVPSDAQNSVGIGTQTPHASAMLEVNSTGKGMLVPRMNTAERGAIAAPATGLMVYDTQTNSFWYHNGSAWVNLAAGGGGSGWGLTGNAGTNPANNFLGTTDNQPLVLRVNNQRNGFFDTRRNLFLGRFAGNNLSASPAPADWGVGNVAIGASALENNVNGYGLVAIGDSALQANTGYLSAGIAYGLANTAVGTRASRLNISGSQNTAIGFGVLEISTGASFNTGVGYNALSKTNGGTANTAVGRSALTNNSSGSNNTAIGSAAALSNLIGDNNTAVGFQALIGGSTGSKNVGVGAFTLGNILEGEANVAVGYAAMRMANNRSNLVAIGDSALYNNGLGTTSAEEASRNTAVGSKAMYTNTIGYDNTALGFQALYSNTIGDNNIAIGREAMRLNTTGYFNTSLGNGSLGKNTSGYTNTALGYITMFNNTTGFLNLAVGGAALLANTTGYSNTALGINSLQANTTGRSNLAIGVRALRNNTNHNFNLAIGDSALFNNGNGASDGRDGFDNIGIGFFSGYFNTGYRNTFVGSRAASSTSDGISNTALGYNTLSTNTTGDQNTALGSGADVSAGNLFNATAIGSGATVNASNKIRLGNSSVTVIEGQVAFTTSDGRFKKNINDNVPGLDFISALKPLTYQYKSYEMERFINQQNPERQAELKHSNFAEAESMVHMGFIAQDVEKLVKEKGYNLSLVHAPTNPTDNYSIAYGELVVPLVKAVQEQQAMIVEMMQTIEQLKKELAQLKK